MSVCSLGIRRADKQAMATCVRMPFHGCPDVHKHISLGLGLVSGLGVSEISYLEIYKEGALNIIIYCAFNFACIKTNHTAK